MGEEASPEWETLDIGGNRHLVRGKHGLFLTNANDIYIGRSLLKYGEFSDFEFQLMRALVRPGDVVVEVGCHMGAFTIPLAKAVGPNGRVFGYEPQAALYQILCANIALNRLGNIEVRNEAVGPEEGTLRVPILDYDKENNFGGLGFSKPYGNGREVPVVMLDREFDNLPAMRLIKIDAEGMEESILRGAEDLIRSHRPAIYLEDDRPDAHGSLTDYLLGDLSYRAFWHVPPMFNPDNHFNSAENLFGNVRSFNLICIPGEAEANFGKLTELKQGAPHPLEGAGQS